MAFSVLNWVEEAVVAKKEVEVASLATRFPTAMLAKVEEAVKKALAPFK